MGCRRRESSISSGRFLVIYDGAVDRVLPDCLLVTVLGPIHRLDPASLVDCVGRLET